MSARPAAAQVSEHVEPGLAISGRATWPQDTSCRSARRCCACCARPPARVGRCTGRAAAAAPASRQAARASAAARMPRRGIGGWSGWGECAGGCCGGDGERRPVLVGSGGGLGKWCRAGHGRASYAALPPDSLLRRRFRASASPPLQLGGRSGGRRQPLARCLDIALRLHPGGRGRRRALEGGSEPPTPPCKGAAQALRGSLQRLQVGSGRGAGAAGGRDRV